jgi:hypothetical protein
LVKKADLAQIRLTFVVNALRRLYADEGFLTLVRGEAMHTLPWPLAEQLELSEAYGAVDLIRALPPQPLPSLEILISDKLASDPPMKDHSDIGCPEDLDTSSHP